METMLCSIEWTPCAASAEAARERERQRVEQPHHTGADLWGGSRVGQVHVPQPAVVEASLTKTAAAQLTLRQPPVLLQGDVVPAHGQERVARDPGLEEVVAEAVLIDRRRVVREVAHQALLVGGGERLAPAGVGRRQSLGSGLQSEEFDNSFQATEPDCVVVLTPLA